jgi:hypothetical protein
MKRNSEYARRHREDWVNTNCYIDLFVYPLFAPYPFLMELPHHPHIPCSLLVSDKVKRGKERNRSYSKDLNDAPFFSSSSVTYIFVHGFFSFISLLQIPSFI